MRFVLNSKIKYVEFLIFVCVCFIFWPAPTLAAKTELTAFLYKDKNFTVDTETLNSWKEKISIPSHSLLEIPANTGEEITLSYNPQKIYAYLEKLSKETEEPPTEPKLTIINKRATEFVQPKNGTKLNIFDSTQAALLALEKNSKEIELQTLTLAPKTSLASLNSIGIKELIAKGESNFKGSPKNRRHNIKVGVEKMTGIILAPNEEFSFNKFLGPVEEDQGFLPELVIKKEGTVPELGGGLCQVSSTVFRSIVNAGLPIKERKNHAYAVQYYSPQGTDATIYPGSVDLRFINDTQAHILIWPYLKDKDNLVFEIYGTKDSRIVTLQKPFQYDKKEDGSMKATWERQVTKDGKTKTDIFKSVYQSPALFHKEEKFVTATGTTTSTLQIPKIN